MPSALPVGRALVDAALDVRAALGLRIGGPVNPAGHLLSSADGLKARGKRRARLFHTGAASARGPLTRALLLLQTR